MDAHRPAGAGLGLPSPGVAGDADAGTQERPMHRCPLHLIRFWVTTPEGRWSIPGQSGWPSSAPSERGALAERWWRHISSAPIRARPPIPEAASAGDSVSDAARTENRTVVANRGAGPFCPGAGPRAGPPGSDPGSGIFLAGEKVEAGRVLPPAQVRTGVRANHWAE